MGADGSASARGGRSPPIPWPSVSDRPTPSVPDRPTPDGAASRQAAEATGETTGETTADGVGAPVTDSVAMDAAFDVAPHVRPWWGPLVLAAFVALVIATNAAGAMWARWIDVNPEALLALSSRNRYLALTLAAGVSVPLYVLIGAARIAVAFVVCHLIGRAYRTDAIGWFHKYLGLTPEAVDAFNRFFKRAEWVVIPWFAGSNIVAVLSGLHRTPPARLAVLLGVGIAGRLALMWWLARTFEDQLVDFLEWIQRYQWWAVGISVALVVLFNVRNLRGRA